MFYACNISSVKFLLPLTAPLTDCVDVLTCILPLFQFLVLDYFVSNISFTNTSLVLCTKCEVGLILLSLKFGLRMENVTKYV